MEILFGRPLAPVTLASASLSWTGFTDYNGGGAPTVNVPIAGSTTASQSLFNISGLNFVMNSPPTVGEFGYFPIDGSRVLAIEVDRQSNRGIHH